MTEEEELVAAACATAARRPPRRPRRLRKVGRANLARHTVSQIALQRKERAPSHMLTNANTTPIVGDLADTKRRRHTTIRPAAHPPPPNNNLQTRTRGWSDLHDAIAGRRPVGFVERGRVDLANRVQHVHLHLHRVDVRVIRSRRPAKEPVPVRMH